MKEKKENISFSFSPNKDHPYSYPFCCWTTILILLLSIVVSIVYRSVTLLFAIPIFSLLLLFLLTWYSAVCYVFDNTRDSKGQQRHNFDLHTSPRNEPITYKKKGFHWLAWLKANEEKKKRVKKERQVLDRLQKKEWRLRHLLRRNPSPP